MTKANSEKEELLNISTDENLGYQFFSYVYNNFKDTKEPELLLLFDLLFNSLASMAFKSFGPDNLLRLTMIERVKNIDEKLISSVTMAKIEEQAKKQELKIPKMLTAYTKGKLYFAGYTAKDFNITANDIRELIFFTEQIMIRYI